MANIIDVFKPITHVAIRFIFVPSLCLGCSFVAVVPSSASAPVSDGNQVVRTNADSYVKIAVKHIAETESRKTRLDQAQMLNLWVSHHPEDVSLTDVDALAGLMSDPEDGVRAWVAGALGALDGKARSAVPQLQRALQERPCANKPMTSASAIRLALSRIGATPINAPCTDPFGAQ